MIAVDWGTSSFRAYRLDGQGKVLEERQSTDGILAVASGDFPVVLDRQLSGWPGEPIVMSGMVGSRQGWIEVPYVQCPASAKEIALHLTKVDARTWIVPGVSCVDEAGVPDVMRGEETQILGVLDEVGEGLVCLPGTHSKWARVREEKILDFRTYFTGEMFAVLRTHSLLGRMMQDGPPDERAFADGVDRSSDEGGLLHHLFGVRTRGLFAELSAAQAPSYLSGLLIGHELRASAVKTFFVLGTAELAARYEKAAGLLGMTARTLDPLAVTRGLYRLGKEIGL